MTESDWLACEDPQAMLRLYTSDEMPWPSGQPAPISSDRKLRLFACACWRAYRSHWLTGKPTVGFDVEALLAAIVAAESFADNPVGNLVMSSWPLDGREGSCATETVRRIGGSSLAKKVMANFLRDIIGNPFRPVKLPFEIFCSFCKGEGSYFWSPFCPREYCKMCEGTGKLSTRPNWITPTAISIAQAAYKERQADGTIDPIRLMILADALEEAGCSIDEQCTQCKGTGKTIHRSSTTDRFDSFEYRLDCDACHTSGRIANPLLRHLRGHEQTPGHLEFTRTVPAGVCRYCGGQQRESGEYNACNRCMATELAGEREWVEPKQIPHVRGCWALDLILGKE